MLGVSAHNGTVTGLSFLVDGLHLLSFGMDNRLRLWDVLTSRNTLVSIYFIFSFVVIYFYF